MLIELVIILGLALLNGLFAMAELALVSANKSRLALMAKKGDLRAQRALDVANDPAEFLATIQVGITLIGIIAGVFGGVAFADDLADWLWHWPFIRPIVSPLSYVLVIGTITYLSVVLGELVPKQFALSYPEELAKYLSVPLCFMSRLFAPVVWFLERSGALFTVLLPIKPRAPATVNEADIHAMIVHGAALGEIEASEKEMVYRVFRLDDRPIRAFMTPRRDVVWLDLNKPFEESWQTALGVPHSFFPVAEGNLDNVKGFVSMKDLAVIHGSRGSNSISDFLRPELSVPAMSDGLKVLEMFKRKRRHMALVIHEHGGVDGVVTTHDLLEAIVGDIGDFEGQEREIVRLKDGSWLADAALDVQELFLALEVEAPPGKAGDEYHSVGGFVFKKMARVPKVGDAVEWNGFRFEVVDKDGHRIDKIRVQRVLAEANEKSEALP